MDGWILILTLIGLIMHKIIKNRLNNVIEWPLTDCKGRRKPSPETKEPDAKRI